MRAPIDAAKPNTKATATPVAAKRQVEKTPQCLIAQTRERFAFLLEHNGTAGRLVDNDRRRCRQQRFGAPGRPQPGGRRVARQRGHDLRSVEANPVYWSFAVGSSCRRPLDLETMLGSGRHAADRGSAGRLCRRSRTSDHWRRSPWRAFPSRTNVASSSSSPWGAKNRRPAL